MKVAFRAVAVVVLLSLAWVGPLAPLAQAQQPTPPPSQPQMVKEDVKPAPEPEGATLYDAGAVAATMAGLPFKAALCTVGFLASSVVFMATFGTQPRVAASIVEEGCGRLQWIVHADDLKPTPTKSKAFDWETHRYDWER
jgi:hypothetical protein